LKRELKKECEIDQSETNWKQQKTAKRVWFCVNFLEGIFTSNGR